MINIFRTAGIFLIIRCSPIFSEATYILPLITIVGSLTTFFAATTALVQTDLKRVIAYSTCSQLGYMMSACGLSAYNASIFHLSNHATFKALLFLTAGSIIHALGNEQDMRKMGGLANLLPFSYAMILIGSLALMGFPFLSGYYSKDVILEVAYAKFTVTSHFAFWLGSLSAFFTSFYSMRLLFLTFLGEVNTTKTSIGHVHDAPLLMALPMGFLSILSIFIGYLTRDIFVGFGTPFWGKSLAVSSTDFNSLLNAEFLPFYIKIIPVVCSTLGTITAIVYFSFFVQNFTVFSLTQSARSVYTFLNKKWFIDKIYNEFIVQYFLSSGYTFSYKALDRGFFEIFGPTGITNVLETTAKNLTQQQIGLPYSHIRQLTFALLYFFVFAIAFYLNLPFEFIVLILLASFL
jgi:NADH-ubiquinone oxidoreductase chain 5